MQRSRGALPVLLCAAAVLSSLAAAPAADRAVRQALEARYSRWARAHTARSISALVLFLEEETAPNFIFKGPRRTHTKKQELETYRPVLQGKEPWAPAREYRTRIDQLVVHGTIATVRVTDRAVTWARDPKITGDAAGKSHRLTVIRTNRDLWIKTAAGWKLSRREVVSGKQILDAASVPPPRGAKRAERRPGHEARSRKPGARPVNN